MKKITAILIMLFVFTLSSCSSDDPAPATEDAELYFRFSANDQQYSFEPETVGSLRKLIMGYKFENNALIRVSLWMPLNPTVGTHQLIDAPVTDANINTMYSANYMNEEDMYEATSGSLTILEMDNEYIKGTFSFTGTKDGGATKIVSNGSFRAYK